MRIGIDAMGGDLAPKVEVAGAIAARRFLSPNDRIVLVGRQDAVMEQLAGCDGWDEFIEVRHAEQVIGMNEKPVEALRAKPDSSLASLIRLHAGKQLDAVISAGNTGAYVAAAQMGLGKLAGVHRPGIAIVTPTFHGPVALCDVGANVNCRPQHLHQYAVMSRVYLNAIYNLENPRVGLLNVGEEDAKGNELVKNARKLLRGDPKINFIGNVEGRDLFAGTCDAIICDGFVGNVMLKLIEGMADSLVRGLLDQFAQLMPNQPDSLRQAGVKMMKKYDYNEYGGAPLLGVEGICIICHGANNANGITNAVRVAAEFSKHQVNQQITQLLSKP